MGKRASKNVGGISSRAYALVLMVALGITSNIVTMVLTAVGFIGVRSFISNGSWLIYWTVMQGIVTVLTFGIYYGMIHVTDRVYRDAMSSHPKLTRDPAEIIWIRDFYSYSQRTDYWRTKVMLFTVSFVTLLFGATAFGMMLYGGGFNEFIAMGSEDVQIGPAGTYGIRDDRFLSVSLGVFVLSYFGAYLFARFGFLTRCFFVNDKK